MLVYASIRQIKGQKRYSRNNGLLYFNTLVGQNNNKPNEGPAITMTLNTWFTVEIEQKKRTPEIFPQQRERES